MLASQAERGESVADSNGLMAVVGIERKEGEKDNQQGILASGVPLIVTDCRVAEKLAPKVQEEDIGHRIHKRSVGLFVSGQEDYSLECLEEKQFLSGGGLGDHF